MYNPQLETFLVVAETGSFSKASEKLFISPTAVSKQINHLESKIGLALFTRTPRGMTLTAAGESMYRDSLYLIQYAKDSISRAENAEDGNDCTIRIGTSVMTSSQSIAEIWSMLRLSEPNFKFQLVSFENTPENAREILRNLGENIDIVAGVFDENFLQSRKCSTVELSREPICVALSIYHPLAKKDSLEISDLYGENLMIIRKGWNTYVDKLRDDLWNHHPRITIKDFSFYDIEIFNRCASSDELLMAIGKWNNVHPLVKVIPVSWNHTIPFGLLHSPKPTVKVQKLLSAINRSPLSEI